MSKQFSTMMMKMDGVDDPAMPTRRADGSRKPKVDKKVTMEFPLLEEIFEGFEVPQ